jgi:2,4-dienoyl-CoA reductase-like NADH-dependent reductase (Old Yellow Enzyme family)
MLATTLNSNKHGGAASPALFTPLKVRSVEIPNRIVISPMQQYRAGRDGKPNNWHLSHLTKLAVGGAGLVFTEALAIEEQGRATHSDLGIWNDAQREALKVIADEIGHQGAVPGAQLIHAGRKASVQKPWDGYQSLGSSDAARGEEPWTVVGPSAIPANPGWQTPQPLSRDDIRRIIDSFALGARRVAQAGFQALNIHGAHGYLIHSFLSPISNLREDEYGGDLQGRMRFALDVAQAVRSEWPAHLPIFYRLSCIDDLPGGWTIEDTVALSRELGVRGIDVIDCSSRGLGPRGTLATATQTEGFQVPFAERVRAETGLKTMAVGLIRGAEYADSVIREGRSDFVAIAREALYNPHWPLHAALELGHDPKYLEWPDSYGWWLARRARTAPPVQ